MHICRTTPGGRSLFNGKDGELLPGFGIRFVYYRDGIGNVAQAEKRSSEQNLHTGSNRSLRVRRLPIYENEHPGETQGRSGHAFTGNRAPRGASPKGRKTNTPNAGFESLSDPSVLVIGGGPAGLRAAEIVTRRGVQTKLYEQKASPGRKFLVAGRGGLNVTHSEPFEDFVTRYDSPERWRKLLKNFSPSDLRTWFTELGIETFVGTSGRVFPRNIRTPNVLEKWLDRLDGMGCDIQVGRRFHQILGSGPYEVVFQRGSDFELVSADGVIFCLGGASWPQTGSDALWIPEFERLRIKVRQFIPANVGWETPWSKEFLKVAEGKPLKNLEVRSGGHTVRGELVITEYGLEGGALYQLTRELRSSPQIVIDFKPEISEPELRARWKEPNDLHAGAMRSWKLSTAAIAVIEETSAPKTVDALIAATKKCVINLTRPRPIEEAISSAGGIPWEEFNDDLMLKAWPGMFCAGEMIDWEAPTGGYLLQGCFVTGTIAGLGAVKWAKR